VSVQGLVVAGVQVPPLHVVNWKLAPGVAVIVTVSPALTEQLVAPAGHKPGFVVSATATVPSAPGVATAPIVKVVAAKVATSVWLVWTLVIVQPAPCPAHKLPAAQLTKWKLEFVGVAVTVTVSPASTRQLVALQPTLESTTKTLPSAPGVAVAPIVNVIGAKVAVSVWGSVAVATKLQGFVAQELSPVQPVNVKLLLVGVAVIVIASPAVTPVMLQLAGLVAVVQVGVGGGRRLVSVTVTVPLVPAAVAVIVGSTAGISGAASTAGARPSRLDPPRFAGGCAGRLAAIPGARRSRTLVVTRLAPDLTDRVDAFTPERATPARGRTR